METTKTQDIIISRMSDYKSTLSEWQDMTKDMSKPIWIGPGTEERILEKHRYLDKYEYALNAVLEALEVSFEEAEKLYDEWENYCMSQCQE